MTFEWKTFGDKTNPVIALIAPSNAPSGEAGQRLISARIKKLTEIGLCVKAPVFSDENGNEILLIESEVEGRANSQRIEGTMSPAVSPKAGADIIIQCVNNRWNMMPIMGGDSFIQKIPLIIEAFESSPEKKDPSVKFFGLSDATHASILASHGICSFISTPFTSIFTRNEGFLDEAKENLSKALRGEEVTSSARLIISNPSDKLAEVKESFHLPLNIGTIANEAYEKKFLEIPESEKWSFSVEGFIQRQDGSRNLNYRRIIEKFLDQYPQNPPQFIELGNIATREDGSNGYASLLHDETNGRILISDYNIDKILAKKGRSDLDSISSVVRNLEEQNDLIDNLISDLKEMSIARKIPLLHNTRNGHCSNMDVVLGGQIEIQIENDKVFISPSKQQGRSIELKEVNKVSPVNNSHTK